MYKLQVKSANGHAWLAGVPVSPRTQDDGAPDVVHEGPEREEDIGEGTAANTRNDLAPGLPARTDASRDCRKQGARQLQQLFHDSSSLDPGVAALDHSFIQKAFPACVVGPRRNELTRHQDCAEDPSRRRGHSPKAQRTDEGLHFQHYIFWLNRHTCGEERREIVS